MKHSLSGVLLAALAITLTVCGGGRTVSTTPEPRATQQQVETAMLMALHHNRDEVFAHTTSLGDLSWQRTSPGMQNWDCSLAIIEKHNRKYPKTVWEPEGIDLRDKLLGVPTGERKILAEACAEKTIRWAQETIDLSNAFEKP